MISEALVRELRKTVRLHRYEETGSGFFFPEAKLNIGGGVFEHRLNDGPWVVDPNLLPTQGRNMLLDIALGDQDKETAWYMAPFATNTAPTSNLTAANFTATQTEFTNYDEATRALWTPDAAANGVKSNAGTPVSITIGNGAQTAMYGLGLLSASAKSATTGLLAACTLFANARTGLQDGDILGLRYTITLTSS